LNNGKITRIKVKKKGQLNVVFYLKLLYIYTIQKVEKDWFRFTGVTFYCNTSFIDKRREVIICG